jgi:hypothetical protein
VGIERRIEKLEGLYHASGQGSEGHEARETQRKDLLEKLRRGRKKAEREALAGDYRRLRAIEELERAIVKKAENPKGDAA